MNAAPIRDTPPSGAARDTICFTIDDVKRNISYRQALEADIEVYKDDVRILSSVITNLETALAKALRADSVSQDNVRLLREQIQLHKDNRADLESKVATLEKDLRREKRKRKLTGIIGMAATVALAILWLTK